MFSRGKVYARETPKRVKWLTSSFALRPLNYFNYNVRNTDWLKKGPLILSRPC